MRKALWLAAWGTLGAMAAACGSAHDDVGQEESALTSGVLTVTATTSSSWNAGYCENVTVANGGTAAVTSWTVVLSLGNATLSNSWNGTFAASGSTVTVTPLSWNASIGAGGATSFGFCTNASTQLPGATVVSASASGGGSTGSTSSSSQSTSTSTSTHSTSSSSSTRTTSSTATTTTTHTTTSSTSTSSTSTSSSSSSTGGGGSCTWANGPSSNNGELTCYWFGQGTATGGGCSSYKTFCGYCGSESGGSTGGVCPGGINDSVQNISTPYFAAFPVGTFGQGTYCGMCVDVSYGGKSITATIIDECATCPTSNHIDLGLSAAQALGLGQNGATGDPTSGVTWKAVDCPVGGDIVANFNNGYSGQVYFQNVAFPVKSATANGHTASQQFGYWDFGTSVAGASVTLTDGVGHTVTGHIPSSSGGSVGVQFPASCQ